MTNSTHLSKGHPFPRQMFVSETLWGLAVLLQQKTKFQTPDDWFDLVLKLLWEGVTDEKTIGLNYEDTLRDYEVQLKLEPKDEPNNPNIGPMNFTRMFVFGQLVHKLDYSSSLRDAVLDEEGFFDREKIPHINFISIFEELHKIHATSYNPASTALLKNLRTPPKEKQILWDAALKAYNDSLTYRNNDIPDRDQLPKKVGSPGKAATAFIRELHLTRLRDGIPPETNEAKFLIGEARKKKFPDLLSEGYVNRIIRENKKSEKQKGT
ncbi:MULTISPECIES: hypothetical protein [unclassified Pseudovibrio]|uniref:hypothetical protein n=1 Tax=unclassified Pseudovibrio TaxID=2627060 RepID=UPI0007AE8605|nr:MULTISPECIES: hypothetical protein [unclassified Pseudovibrio]KZK94451.1 hypothetical protein PsW74_04593 [Pseudovibrio sp. W74]KZL07189.1 hypothetical protein PsAD14_04204 [Pseudovibrio sp. Ad14]